MLTLLERELVAEYTKTYPIDSAYKYFADEGAMGATRAAEIIRKDRQRALEHG